MYRSVSALTLDLKSILVEFENRTGDTTKSAS